MEVELRSQDNLVGESISIRAIDVGSAKHGNAVTQNHNHETTGTLMVKLTKAFASEWPATTSG